MHNAYIPKLFLHRQIGLYVDKMRAVYDVFPRRQVIALNCDWVHSPQLSALVNLAIHRAPKREALVCRGAPLPLATVDFSRGLAPGWQTKGEDFTFVESRSNIPKTYPEVSESILERHLSA